MRRKKTTNGPLPHPLDGKLAGVTSAKECKKIDEENRLPYVAFFEDCEQRSKRGDRQLRCAECSLVKWTPERCPLFKPARVQN